MLRCFLLALQSRENKVVKKALGEMRLRLCTSFSRNPDRKTSFIYYIRAWMILFGHLRSEQQAKLR